MPYVYIVECTDGSLYTGWSIDVEARVKAHNAGRGGRYTRTHRPVKLVYLESHRTRGAAMKREVAIKTWPRKRKIQLISDQGSKKNK
ncbi:MAG TPA: GIY-YIG nuclease family protein [Anaerolineae bacterium]|nr:GIY-YIG nuclease family protein [Anaerolineae bacterium]